MSSSGNVEPIQNALIQLQISLNPSISRMAKPLDKLSSAIKHEDIIICRRYQIEQTSTPLVTVVSQSNRMTVCRLPSRCCLLSSYTTL